MCVESTAFVKFLLPDVFFSALSLVYLPSYGSFIWFCTLHSTFFSLLVQLLCMYSHFPSCSRCLGAFHCLSVGAQVSSLEQAPITCVCMCQKKKWCGLGCIKWSDGTYVIPDAELLCSSHAWSLLMYTQCYMPLFNASYADVDASCLMPHKIDAIV